MDFKQKLEEIDAATTKKQKRSIHFKSLRNFIYYYDRTKKEKRRITTYLEEYINLLERKNYSFTKEESLAACELFIDTLGKKYIRYFNFESHSVILVIIVFLIIANMLICIVFHSYIIRSIGLLILILVLIKYIEKFRKWKTYGFRW
jgi:hypothetical protein